jgi:21S rRNA (GM2251-2'-O)-methyltransferase
MINRVLSRSLHKSKSRIVILTLLYPPFSTVREASLNSGINRGLRRSKGVGFRGKERDAPRDGPPTAPIRRTADGADKFGPEITRGGWRGSSERGLSREDRNGATLNTSRGKKSSREEAVRPRKSSREQRPGLPNGKPSSFTDQPSIREKSYGRGIVAPFAGRGDRRSRTEPSPEPLGVKRGAREYDEARSSRAVPSATRPWDRSDNSFDPRYQHRITNSKEIYPSLSQGRPSYELKVRGRDPKLDSQFSSRGSDERAESRNPSYDPRNQKKGFKSNDQYTSPTRTNQDASSGRLGSPQSVNKRIPLSIPYTTPASEFLYGTSVVEAALNSQRNPRRKHYKLYIYAGENRASEDRDAGIERLARRKGIEVSRVSGDWLRIMDKMSGGRPHNGYILEASPLPRLPIVSLGEVVDQDGEPGFKVTVDHQSREEAAVNGISDFVKLPDTYSQRKPLVLLLDSIEDPGNLGSIIRTASFLGVTAVAISTRNSASFSPIVLKASAGASENITLFSVSKPAGFITNSKLAGWKVFAGVAPSKQRNSYKPKPLSTDQLEDPLSEDPCILMLGGEGEGLRMNLRSKADVDLSIRGSGHSNNVDSLNVSVAAGILCNAFLRRNQQRRKVVPVQQVARSESSSEFAENLF